jgi:hypothetical protein
MTGNGKLSTTCLIVAAIWSDWSSAPKQKALAATG